MAEHHSRIEEGALLVYGSPLLDIIVHHPSATTLLDKYELQPDGSVFAEEKHQALYREVEEQWSDSVRYVPGGTALNVARAVQWQLATPAVTTFFGGLGRDRHAEELRTRVESAGLSAHYHVSDEQPTGTCLTIVTERGRSMVSHMQAAGAFSDAHLRLPCHWALVERACIFYAVSFSLANQPAVLLNLARHATERRKTFCLNLSAPFLCRRYKEALCQLLPFVHVLFGNQAELDEFGNINEWDFSPGSGGRAEVAQRLAGWEQVDGSRPRLVVITQGALPVLVARTGHKVREHAVPTLPAQHIVDTSGAGDAFVGGFLARLLQGGSVEDCVACGISLSAEVLKHIGCSFS